MRVQDFSELSNHQLMGNLKNLVGKERENKVHVIVHLGEVEDRRIFATKGYDSMHRFCQEELHFSEYQAFLRINAARLAKRFPIVLSMLSDGRIHLSALGLLRNHLSEMSHRALLNACTYKSKRQVEVIIAQSFPKPDLPSSVRRVPVKRTQKEEPEQVLNPTDRVVTLVPNQITENVGATACSPRPESSTPGTPHDTSKPNEPHTPSVPTSPPSAKPGTARPLAAERYAIRFTASKELLDKVERVRDLISHKTPHADIGEVIDQALEVYVAHLEKKRFAVENRKIRKSEAVQEEAPLSPETNAETNRDDKPSRTRTRHVPNHIKRVVYERDGGCCSYVGPDGRKCLATRNLEFDHIEPYATGGASTVDNLRLRCRIHNIMTAESVFGREKMDRYRPRLLDEAESPVTLLPPVKNEQANGTRPPHSDFTRAILPGQDDAPSSGSLEIVT